MRVENLLAELNSLGKAIYGKHTVHNSNLPWMHSHDGLDFILMVGKRSVSLVMIIIHPIQPLPYKKLACDRPVTSLIFEAL